jgi:hypothetical protein
MEDQPITKPLPTQNGTTQKDADMHHVSRGIRIHGTSVQAVQNRVCPRPSGH